MKFTISIPLSTTKRIMSAFVNSAGDFLRNATTAFLLNSMCLFIRVIDYSVGMVLSGQGYGAYSRAVGDNHFAVDNLGAVENIVGDEQIAVEVGPVDHR